MKRRNQFKNSLVVLLCLLAAGASSCRQQTETPAGSVYRTMEVALSDRTVTSMYSASIQGRQDVEIYPQVSGLITDVCVRDGAEVKKGQVLFVIDQIPYKAALETALANVENAEASVATAQMTVDSKEELYGDGIVSEFDLRTARNSLRQTQAALAQERAELTNARNNLSYTEVKSPVDGTAGMIPYRIGALVSSSMTTPLVTVSDNASMYAYFSMTENQILALSRTSGGISNPAETMPEVELLLSDGSAYPEKGHVDAISGIIDSRTGAVSIRAVFPNPERILRSGGQGNVLVPHERKGCIVIPQEATYEIQDKIFVYKVVDGMTKSVQITVFPVNDGKEYIVESGLEEGDVIVAEGAGLLRDGVQVDNR